MKKVFLISHSPHTDSYTDAYGEILKNVCNFKTLFWRQRSIIGRAKFNLNILMLPINCTVIIENISFGMEALLLRRDINVIHIPRGGGTFKIGWRSSGKLSFYVKLRLRRRNMVFVSSEIFRDYLSIEEITPKDKFKLCLEPICIIPDTLPRTDVLIALSECAQIQDYKKIIKKISDENLLVSYHPILSKKGDLYDLKKVKRIVTDCTTLCNYGFIKGLNVNIVLEKQSLSRELFAAQSSFFSGISEIGNVSSSPMYTLVDSTISDFQSYVLQS